MRKLTTEEFIKRANKIHKNKYNYSKTEYINSLTKVCIICPEHGEFWQTPNGHLSGKGCSKCSCNTLLTTEQFIQNAKKIHGDKYDYSKVEYINNSKEVIIICPIHGEFKQIARNHISGSGCPKCGKISMSLKQSYTLSEFINISNKIHNNKYDYSNVEYNGINKKVTIFCPEHGEFKQTPSAHINNKQGCPKCGFDKISNSKKLTTEDFISKANKIHKNIYNYSNVIYSDYNTPIDIICIKHGIFKQTPDAHLQGKGCPNCGHSISMHESEIVSFLKEKLCTEINIRNRDIIRPYELDIVLPEYKLAIEYNGLRWHSNKFKNNKNYHLNKLNLCIEKGYKLIQIFQEE